MRAHLVDWLHEAQAEGAKAVILNAGGYTHTSVALHDAIKSITVAGDRGASLQPRTRARSSATTAMSAARRTGTHRRLRRAFAIMLALDAAARL